ncbi:hypothetical protein [Yoonia sp.]|uniref:hypothetical protein n=1 Tax=Yoonia sp. TaxID=2212373 RepID=UPI00344E2E10
MADAYVDKVANELADLALADQAASGDIGVVDMIGEILGASSQTLQETYLTAIRVRRAEARARAILDQRAANGYKAPPKPKAAPLQGLSDEDKEAAEAVIAAEAAGEPPAVDTASEPQDTATPAANMPRRVTR